MDIILLGLIGVVLTGSIKLIDELLVGVLDICLYADKYMTSVGGGSLVNGIFDVVLGTGVSLIILKFLKKGFECYVLWTDVDADSKPILVLTRFAQAIIITICFPSLYMFMAEITEEMTNQILNIVGTDTNYDWQTWVNYILSLGLVNAIFGLIFLICYFMLYFQFLMRGLEILILRIGIPFACVGLLDNDKGIFKPYMNKFFQSMFASIIQIALCKLGIGLMLNVGININMFWGIACLVLAIKTPRFLAEFLIPTGGGNFVNNIYNTGRLVGMAKSLITKKP
ncbi:MAG: hypothetical protein KIC92_07530 [Clostridiales bacterium]|nr:hypothetical protein [Clostridiales bacterium]